MEIDLKKLVKYRNEFNPFLKLLGAEVVEISEGYSKVVLQKVNSAHLNGNGWVHGGLLYSLGDIACGSLMSYYGKASSTIDGHLHYLEGSKEGCSIVAEAFLVRKGNRISFLEVKIYENGEKLLATGNFTYYSYNKNITT